MAWPIIIGRDLLPSLNVYLTHFKNYLSLTQSPQRGIGIQNQNLLDEATNEISAIDVYGLETELDVGPTLSSKDSAIVLSIIKENYLNNSTQCTQLTNYKMKINLTHQTPIFTKPPSMVHVDALSRTEAVGAISELDLDFQLQVAQSRDPAIDSMKRKLEAGPVNGFVLQDGLEFLESHNISHVLNATGSPQANGQVERVNQFLDSKTTDVSRDLNRIRSEAQENIKTSQARNEQYFADRNKPVPNFTEGDLVAIKYTDTSGVNKKLNCRFRGPYVIHKVLPHDRYVVRDVEGCQNTQMAYDGVLEADKLRRWASNM
ncbi:uncharacterized protein LOC126567516 [Anopheles maculipalpis]|uniref:uncharacterized protein LOC126567516 n=1 Tax=Anopheles maculipalpis TaxID=1496333 RepID=UPI0021598E94|nr:uncharacterized protein LOC126567516 [Anopheles maculipalpis]